VRSTQTQAQGGQPARPLTDDPTDEATAIRGLWFGLLISIPFWLVMVALALLVF
jgi:hypothetical protein